MYGNYMPQFRQPIQQYQPIIQPQIQPQTQQTMPLDEKLYVPNEQAAEAYLMAPNSFVRLWNANEPIFYEKRTDGAGRPLPIEAFKYEKMGNQVPIKEDMSKEFVTRKEFEDLVASMTPKKKKGEETNG